MEKEDDKSGVKGGIEEEEMIMDFTRRKEDEKKKKDRAVETSPKEDNYLDGFGENLDEGSPDIDTQKKKSLKEGANYLSGIHTHCQLLPKLLE